MNIQKLFVSYTRNLFINTPEKPAYKVILTFSIVFTIAFFLTALTESKIFGLLFALAGTAIICAYHKPDKSTPA